jgi:predicted permease
MHTLLQDLRYGLRMLAKNPGFTAVALATLALGIGANTAIFSLMNAVMFHSMPVADPQHLVVLQWTSQKAPEFGYSSFGDCKEGRGEDHLRGCSFSYPMFREFRSKTDTFSGFAGFAGPRQLSASGNGPARIANTTFVSGDFFNTLGIRPAVGRTLQPADEAPGADPAVVLSYACWQSDFGGARDVVNQKIRLNNVSFSIVGVASQQFTFLTPGKSQDMWIPLTQVPQLKAKWAPDLADSADVWLAIVARLKPSVTAAQAQAAAAVLFRNTVLHGDKPLFKDAENPGLALVNAQDGLVGIREELGAPLYLLMAAVGLVLLIACANVGGLLLARGTARQREMAVRLALGAGRGRVIRQLLTESVLLSVAGSALGALLASWGVHALVTFLTAGSGERLAIDVTPDLHVLAFTVGAASLTGILFGIAPAFRSSRVDVAPTLKENSGSISNTSVSGGRRGLFGSSLVVVQVALSILVLVGAGLFLRTLINLKSIDPGFETRNVLLFGIDPTLATYTPERTQTLYSNLQTQLSALPGVTAVSYSSDSLLSGALWAGDITLAGQPADSPALASMLGVGPNFFETMHLPLLAGRTFSSVDVESQRPVVIVNQTFVNKFFPGRNALGQHLGTTQNEKKIDHEIVGIAADAKYESVRRKIEPTIYLPIHNTGVYFELRTAMDTAAIIPSVRKIVASLDADLPIFGVKTQTEAADHILFGERLLARLSSIFGAIALLLTCVGLYGLLSYEVTLRTREIGIRSALGAEQNDILRLVVGQGMRLAAIGAALGVALAFALTRFLQSILYGVRASDPLTFASVVMLLAAVAAIACGVPARRASRVDPMAALRYE